MVSRGKLVVLTQGIWMVSTLAVLVLLDLFTVESYFLVSFVGLLAVMQLYAPARPQPDWWTWLRVIQAGGFVVFGYVLYIRIIVFA